MMKRFFTLATTTLMGLSGAGVAQASYWNVDFRNADNHFYAGTNSSSPFYNNWVIEPGDQYVTGQFFVNPGLVAIKPGQENIKLQRDTAPLDWMAFPNISGTKLFAQSWKTSANDLQVSGNFTHPYFDSLLLANPNGHYQTFNFNVVNRKWDRIQAASNSDVDPGDQLIAGDFDGDQYDEVILIKANGEQRTLDYNRVTNNWDISNATNTGFIHWWRINTSTDKYVAGDFDGNGVDELLAINPNGWHHTMRYQNGQWQFIEGGSPATGSSIASWNVTSPASQYLSADFNGNGKDEVVAINPSNGWSQLMEMSSTGKAPQWTTLVGNGGNGLLSWQWPIGTSDVYRVWGNPVHGYQLLAINPNGAVGLLSQ